MSVIKKKLLTNSFWNWIHYFITVAVTFIVSPILVNSLGSEGYGLWTIVGSLIGYYGLMDVGIRNALVRFVAKYKGEDNINKLNEFVNACFAIFSCAALVVFILTALTTYMLPLMFDFNTDLLSDARLTVLFLGIGFALQFPLNALSGILVGIQRYDITSKIWIVVCIVQNILYVIVLKNGMGIVAIAILNSVSGLFAYTAMACFGWKLVPGLKITLKIPLRSTIRELFSYSSYVFIIGIAGRIFNYTSPIVIGRLLGMTSVAYYAIPVSLLSYANSIVLNFCRVLQPYASNSEASGKKQEISETALWSVRISLIIYAPVFILVCLFGTDFIGIWIGKSFSEGAAGVLPVLALAYVFAIAEMPLENILMGMGAVRVISFILIGEAVISLILMLILIRSMGIVGAAWGTAIPMFITRGILIPKYAAKKINFSLKNYYISCIGMICLFSLPAWGVGVFFRNQFTIKSYSDLAVNSLPALISYFVAIFLFTAEGKTMRKIIFRTN